MDFSDKLALLVAVLSLLVLLSGVFLLPSAEVPPETENETDSEVSAEPAEQKKDVWSLLNNDNVEEQCLRQARAFAKKQGFPEFFVSGCRCTNNESANVKFFDCSISAIDRTYEIEANCVKSEERCLFTSLEGAIVYTFDEMEKLMID